MLREISRKVDYVTEGISLLQHLGAGKSYKDLKEELNKKYANSFREGLRKFEVLEQIEQTAESAFREDMETIQYYFPEQKNGELSCPGKLVLLWDFFEVRGFQEDMETYKAYLEGLLEPEYCEKFGKCLQGYTAAIAQDDAELIKMGEPYDVISYLMKMEIGDEDKWKIQKIFFDRTEHIGKVYGLLEKAVLLLQGFQEELEELVQMFHQYWAKQLEGREIAEYLKEMAGINVGGSPLGFCLQASIIRPNVIRLNADMGHDGTYNTPDYYRWGVLFGEDFDISMSPAQEKDGFENFAMQALKLLADRSKFEILTYIRDREAYGSELAKHLNLTTATVSHHMNALLTAGLVGIRRVDNRVYYTSNKEALEEVFAYCRKVLI